MVFMATCLLHGGIIFVLIHFKAHDKSLKTADGPLTIFLVRPQPAMAIALPKPSMIERRSLEAQEHLLDSATPVPDISVPPVDGQTSEDPANIDWTGEAQRSAAAIASRVDHLLSLRGLAEINVLMPACDAQGLTTGNARTFPV